MPRFLAVDCVDLDMNSGNLSLTFSEVVNVSSLNISDLVLLSYSMANESDVMHRLTPGLSPRFTSTDNDNGLVVILQLGTEDLYEIQRKNLLATETSNTFLSFTNAAIMDMNMNPIIAITTDDPVNVDTFTVDSKRGY